jgi:hypothetical protein
MNNLPQIISDDLPLFPTKAVEAVKDATLQEDQVTSIDMQLDHHGFMMLAWAWSQVECINDVAKCLSLQHAHQIHHRNHRLMPNAHQSSSSKIFTVAPLD